MTYMEQHNGALGNAPSGHLEIKMKDLNQIVTDIIDQTADKYMTVFGVRAITVYGDSQPVYAVGDDLPPSREWIDNTSSDVLLGGTSSLAIDYDGIDVYNIDKTLSKLAPYAAGGAQIVLIGGRPSNEDGNDVGEIIIADAKVLHIFI